jgi:hypothetical protein
MASVSGSKNFIADQNSPRRNKLHLLCAAPASYATSTDVVEPDPLRYGSRIIGSDPVQAPVAERPVALPPDSLGSAQRG